MNLVNYLFENSSKLKKDFVLGNKETISYNELVNQSREMAAYLSDNFGEGNNIIVISNNNRFFLVCYLGVMLSGNVCVPLNPMIENRNFEYIVEHTNSPLCFVEERLQKSLSFSKIKTITNFNYQDFLKPNNSLINSTDFNANRSAQIIFTSGSTGLPKGVVLSHKNIIANTNSIIKYLKLSGNDIMEVVLPFYYCYGLSLLHTHLRVGGSIVINNNFIFTGTLIDDLIKYKCTGFAGVPSHFQILLRKTDAFINSQFPDLRYVTQAGGKLHTTFIKEFVSRFPAISFYVMYGQTEATARLSFLDPRRLAEKTGSIGKGIPGVELKVVNQLGDKVKPGETGEILARGENIMKGYFKDEEMTRKTIKDKWLYTGDLGTIDNEGFIYLTGRKKEMIKVFGKRVSPKEIEEIIVSIPEVIDCTVESISDEITGEAIKATVVLNNASSGSISENDIKSYCAKKLAQFKVPSLVEITNRLNVNSAGKKVTQNL